MDLVTSPLHLHRVAKTPITHFQVFGERASGTNVVRKTIEKNIAIERTDALGWKHGFPHMVAVPTECLVICVARNAADWALSMHKRPWHAAPAMQKLDFDAFIRAEWHSIVDRASDFAEAPEGLGVEGRMLQHDRHPLSGRAFENLFRLRSLKLEALLGMRHRGCSLVFVQFEFFRDDPERFVEALCQAYGLARSTDTYQGVTRRMGNLWKSSVKARPETPKALSAENLAFMKRNLDLDVEARFGYSY
ncbi:hypothetical protein [Pseudaestuariivita sp.]|uniref:hypothetical protein n=1 Tax=Pseudaestuariivita sp. TaxID=2211669 RepID=UPI0040582520